MEGRALVAETVLAGAKLQEVTGGLGDNVVVELEVDLLLLICCGDWLAKELDLMRLMRVVMENQVDAAIQAG